MVAQLVPAARCETDAEVLGGVPVEAATGEELASDQGTG